MEDKKMPAEKLVLDTSQIYRPRKKIVTFRIDLDNLLWLQRKGTKGYQTRINKVLRWARQNGCPESEL